MNGVLPGIIPDFHPRNGSPKECCGFWFLVTVTHGLHIDFPLSLPFSLSSRSLFPKAFMPRKITRERKKKSIPKNKCSTSLFLSLGISFPIYIISLYLFGARDRITLLYRGIRILFCMNLTLNLTQLLLLIYLLLREKVKTDFVCKSLQGNVCAVTDVT